MRDKLKIKITFILAIIVCAIYLLFDINANNAQYLLYRRVPRLIAMIAVAISITISTSLFQTIANNRILTPDLLGYSQMYVMLQTLVIFIFGSYNLISNNAYVNFIFLTILMISFSFLIFLNILKRSKHNLYLLLLVGTILNTLFSSVSSFMQLIIDPNEFSVLQSNIIASFNNINTDVIYIACLLLLIPIPWIIKNLNKFDVLQLGQDYALNLGINIKSLYATALIIISILISVSTALVGPLVFLGMLVVNLSRLSINSYQHKKHMTLAMLLSVIFVVGGQFIIDKVFSFSITLSVLLNLIGGIYMIYLMMKERSL